MGDAKLTTGTRRRPRALIVEDHEDTREVTAWSLLASGWRVDAVTNGAEAIDLAAALAPDVIVMDLHLPVVDGIAATARLKQDPRTANIPVVAFSAFARDHSEQDLRIAGFEMLVPKPCSPDELRARLEEILVGRVE